MVAIELSMLHPPQETLDARTREPKFATATDPNARSQTRVPHRAEARAGSGAVATRTGCMGRDAPFEVR